MHQVTQGLQFCENSGYMILHIMINQDKEVCIVKLNKILKIWKT